MDMPGASMDAYIEAEEVNRLNRELRDGENVQELLNSPWLVEAFDALEKLYFEGAISRPPNDDDGRRRLTEAVSVLRTVKDHLKRYVRKGDAAQVKLREIERLKRGLFS